MYRGLPTLMVGVSSRYNLEGKIIALDIHPISGKMGVYSGWEKAHHPDWGFPPLRSKAPENRGSQTTPKVVVSNY